jgi:hypothetical protein
MNLKDSDLQWTSTGLCVFYCIAKLKKRIPGKLQNHTKKTLNKIYIDYWGPFKVENLINL